MENSTINALAKRCANRVKTEPPATGTPENLNSARNSPKMAGIVRCTLPRSREAKKRLCKRCETQKVNRLLNWELNPGHARDKRVY